MSERLPPHQFALLKVLGAGVDDPTIEHLAQAAALDQALISAAATELRDLGLVSVDELAFTELKLGELGGAIARGEAELPERLVARAVLARGGTASIKDLSGDESLKAAGVQAGKFGKNLATLGWAGFEKGALTVTGTEEPGPCAIELALRAASEAGGSLIVEEAGGEVEAALPLLKGRKELAVARERSRRTVALTAEGEKLAAGIAGGDVTEVVEANELTPEMLGDGGWRSVRFRPYDVTLKAERAVPGKPHPLQRIVERTRQAFLELGFSEASCPMAELAFWNFDALFQPQDHPAREMQDTFYCKEPDSYALPEQSEWVEAVKRTHEDGWETGSRGWRYQWSPRRAAQVVLRTHMTASSIEAIARNPFPPQKIFSIGRVFRRETVDFKHLPEFMQVDGIIIDEHASFSSLLGTLKAFYERMGLPEVAFKPDFFPYTEPSVGVQILWGGKWFEMGGAGVFRPEVTEPFGCRVPVLAWGLGLERLAMAVYNVPYMKDLYQSDLDWLKSAPLEA